jgi:magnesium-transporting ATPase (P-type)
VLEANFFVNQTMLTGITFPVEKLAGIVPDKSSLAERTNVVFMGLSTTIGPA